MSVFAVSSLKITYLHYRNGLNKFKFQVTMRIHFVFFPILFFFHSPALQLMWSIQNRSSHNIRQTKYWKICLTVELCYTITCRLVCHVSSYAPVASPPFSRLFQPKRNLATPFVLWHQTFLYYYLFLFLFLRTTSAAVIFLKTDGKNLVLAVVWRNMPFKFYDEPLVEYFSVKAFISQYWFGHFFQWRRTSKLKYCWTAIIIEEIDFFFFLYHRKFKSYDFMFHFDWSFKRFFQLPIIPEKIKLKKNICSVFIVIKLQITNLICDWNIFFFFFCLDCERSDFYSFFFFSFARQKKITLINWIWIMKINQVMSQSLLHGSTGLQK